MKTYLWLMVFFGIVFIELCALNIFKVPPSSQVYIAVCAAAGVLTNWTLKRIKREP